MWCGKVYYAMRWGEGEGEGGWVLYYSSILYNLFLYCFTIFYIFFNSNILSTHISNMSFD